MNSLKRISFFSITLTLPAVSYGCSDALRGQADSGETSIHSISSSSSTQESESSESSGSISEACPTGTWSYTIIDDHVTITTRPNLVVVGTKVFMTYFDGIQYEVFFASYDGSNISTELVSPIGYGTSPSITADSSGQLHLFYVDNGTLMHGKCAQSAAQCTPWALDQVSDVWINPSTESLFVNDSPQVSATSYEEGYVEHYNINEDNTWDRHIVGAGQGTFHFGYDEVHQALHLVYTHTFDGPYNATTQNFESWSENGPLTDKTVFDTAIAIGTDGTQRIFITTNSELSFIESIESEWSTEKDIIDGNDGYVRAIGSGTRSFVSYVTHFPDKLYFACIDASGNTTVESMQDDVMYPSAIAADASGNPLVLFSNASGYLTLATFIPNE